MTRLGPIDPLRSADTEGLLPIAVAAARSAGVTRLADITRLDRIGLPVWQAVRPMSRALSVHQGKGATAADAKVGALLEAVESDRAERFSATSLRCPFEDLPRDERPHTISDFAADRAQAPPTADSVDWVRGEPLPGCKSCLVPSPVVSLDFTLGVPSLFDRASNGIATGRTRDEAAIVALHELIERDAVTEWLAGDIGQRMAATVAPASVPFPWYRNLEARIERAGARLRCYLVPSVTGTPVFACEINDPTKAALPYRTANGRAAHPLPEIALFKAVAEACQARATLIAGARDDLYPWRYSERESAIQVAFGLPPPPGMPSVAFTDIANGPDTLASICSALAARGYRQAVAISLGEADGLFTVRVVVPGLGSISRRRRDPLQ